MADENTSPRFVFGPDDTRMELASGDRLLLGAADTGGRLSVITGVIAGIEGPPLHTHLRALPRRARPLLR